MSEALLTAATVLRAQKVRVSRAATPARAAVADRGAGLLETLVEQER
ncbi:hypothetical protein QL996_07410 [Planococcus sp. APC 4015]|nr:hypothetical protein [Planococcus sp. APC 4015]